jgi:hypothetical protein
LEWYIYYSNLFDNYKKGLKWQSLQIQAKLLLANKKQEELKNLITNIVLDQSHIKAKEDKNKL